MKDKLEVGMYVRTKWGIAKIIEISEEIIYVDTCFQLIDETRCYKEDIVGEPSFNPIDLIEVGDYVNDYKVVDFELTYFNGIDRRDEPKKIGVVINKENKITNDIYKIEDIKSIVTKEQFESMEYKLGDDKN